MSGRIHTVLLPTRPQPDTIVALFLLEVYGGASFPGLADAEVKISPTLPAGSNFENLLQDGILPLDVGGGPFDHHGTDYCASEIVARFLSVEKKPELHQLLSYARRDDKEGKGTVSKDGIDRAFGLSGLIASLNKVYTSDPTTIVRTILPLLRAHHASATEHHVVLPNEVLAKKARGEYEEEVVRQGGMPLNVVYVTSDRPTMPTFLRSQQGPRADVVVLKSEQTNHVSILTKQDRGVDLSQVAGLIRLYEAQLRNLALSEEEQASLTQTGSIASLTHWYFDPATNSILNGGPHNKHIAETAIPWDVMKRVVRKGLEIGKAKNSVGKSSYYLSINIPPETASRILKNFSVGRGAMMHTPENLHVTLEYFGERTLPEANQLADAIARSLTGVTSFTFTLRSEQLRVGAIEGYTTSGAWYLSLDGEDVADMLSIRNAVAQQLGNDLTPKQLHVTVASKTKDAKVLTQDSARAQTFSEEVTVSEIVLMESVSTERGRTYRPFRSYALS